MDQIVTLTEARQQGLKYYYTGKPCTKGHIGQRYVTGKCCCICTDEKSRSSQNRGYQTQWSRNQRRKLLDLLGGKCAHCGFTDYRALQIDHIEGGGMKDIRSFGNMRTYYKNVMNDKTAKYQILCANCNWIKRHENNENRKYPKLAIP